MKKTKQYRSPVMASIHETAEGLHDTDLPVMRLLCKLVSLSLAM